VTISIDFYDALPVGSIEKAINSMAVEIKTNFPRVKKVFIEAEKGLP